VRLGRELGRTVVDMTGLTGTYDFTLDWARVQPPSLGADGAPLVDSGGPSLFSAVQEQLGLKLESRKQAIDMIIVDHAEKPSEN
jgi:uncharacterized protein (TIGR03435 family)